MRTIALFASMTTLALTGCVQKGANPIDPYEKLNRKIYHFNMKIDKAVLKPVARGYKALLPGFMRKGVNNFYNNLDMVPSVANDLLQGEGKWAIKDTWRLAINSTLGVGGLFDVAQKMGLPAHYNDLGLTFAKWGDKSSPFIMIPFFGPGTIRDGYGMLFQFTLWTPYLYVNNDATAWGMAALRYVDLRTQLLDSEGIMDEALDEYSFIRDAYLQHRTYLINGTALAHSNNKEKDTAESNTVATDYVDE
ncbi:MAG: ABC transporter [Legionella sp.]|nr:MAG: ABC transporter [Legionella sp.]PJD99135.1 MAG: ABC transporter [Legionella sp.]